MNIELMGVTFLKLAIGRNDYLVPHINDGDREPSWDGDIEVYRKPGNVHSKGDLVLKVPIQVKGHAVPQIPRKNTISYSIETSDLRNYLNAGGTMFFVVYVDETGTNHQIYYTSLLPFELKQMLEKYGEQKTRNMPLVVFPQDNNSIANILLNCARDMKKQRPAIVADRVTYDSLIQAGQVPELSFGYAQVSKDSTVPFEYMFDHSTYLYAKLPHGIELPIEKMEQMDVAFTEVEAPVKVKGQVFYNSYRVVYKKDCMELCFGKSSRFVHYYNPERSKFSFNLAGTLSERIVDEAFIIAALEAGEFEVATVQLPLKDVPPEELQQFNVPRKLEHLNWLKCVKETLDRMSVTVDLDCKNLSNTDEGRLHMLKQSVLDGEPITLHEVPNRLCRFAVGNLSIIAYLQEVDAKQNLYQVCNFNHVPIAISAEDRDGNLVPSSLYMLFKRDILLECSNIDYQEMLRQIKLIPFSEVFSTQATNLLLEMLAAYDESKDKRKDIIEAAVELAEWIRNEDSFYPANLKMINHLQAIKRIRELNADERRQVIELIERDTNLEERVYVGAYLLLDQQEAAELHFSRMEKEEREHILRYPISRFWCGACEKSST